MTSHLTGPNNVTRSHRQNTSYKKPWVQVYENTILDSWFVGDYSSASYHITVEFDSNQKETMQVLVVARPDHASYTIFGRTSIQNELILLSASVTSSKLSLIVNPTSSAFAGSKLIFTASYAETIIPLGLPTTVVPSNISPNPLKSELGFSSPGFNVDIDGNVDILGEFKVNGAPVLGGDTLPSTILNSNLTSVGTLVGLSVNGVVSLIGNGNTSTIDNTVIGNTTPLAGTFTTLDITTLLNIDSGTLTVNPTVSGSLDNVEIGQITPLLGKFTSVTITQTPTLASHSTTKNYVDNANYALKLQATALAIALGS